jgi:hypothetical protein
MFSLHMAVVTTAATTVVTTAATTVLMAVVPNLRLEWLMAYILLGYNFYKLLSAVFLINVLRVNHHPLLLSQAGKEKRLGLSIYKGSENR